MVVLKMPKIKRKGVNKMQLTINELSLIIEILNKYECSHDVDIEITTIMSKLVVEYGKQLTKKGGNL